MIRIDVPQGGRPAFIARGPVTATEAQEHADARSCDETDAFVPTFLPDLANPQVCATEASPTPAWIRVGVSTMLAFQLLSSPAAAASVPAVLPSLGQSVTPIHRDRGPQTQGETAATPNAIDAIRSQVARTDYPPLDPYVATVAQNVDASINTPNIGTQIARLTLGRHFSRPLDIHMNLNHGPDAKMVIIFPGIGNDHTTPPVRQIEDIALKQGLNFAVIPNPFSNGWLDAVPNHLPGVLPNEAETNVDILRSLRRLLPDYFEDVSGVGCSYGGLLGVATLQAQQHHGGEQILNGTFTAVSPPQDLLDSVTMMDQLGDRGPIPYGQVTEVGLRYYNLIRGGRFDTFAQSQVANRGDYLVEQVVAYQGGPRIILETMLRHLRNPPPDTKTFDAYVHRSLSQDAWFVQHGTTVEETSKAHHLQDMLHDVSGNGVPVLVLTSQDDMILNAENVETFTHQAEDNVPDQVVRQYAHGGHLGVLFNPRIRDVVGAFAAAQSED